MTWTFPHKYYLLCFLFLCVPAHAYIDPGIGGFLLQGLIAIGMGFVFQVLRFFKITKKEKNDHRTKKKANRAA